MDSLQVKLTCVCGYPATSERDLFDHVIHVGNVELAVHAPVLK